MEAREPSCWGQLVVRDENSDQIFGEVWGVWNQKVVKNMSRIVVFVVYCQLSYWEVHISYFIFFYTCSCLSTLPLRFYL